MRQPSATALAASASLGQCAGLIDALPQGAYTHVSGVIKGSTIGQHVRHALDHFAAALSSLEGLVIDYDNRERDTPVERDPTAALSLIARLRESLSEIDRRAVDGAVRVRVMLSAAGDEAELGSTLGRELAFASHHATHHHAMIAAIARELGVAVPASFGKAPSTLNHENAHRGEGHPGERR